MGRHLPSARGWEAIQGCRRILRPPPGFTTSVTPSILRKVLRESLPLLETRTDRGGEGRVLGKTWSIRDCLLKENSPHIAASWYPCTLERDTPEQPAGNRLRTKTESVLGQKPHFTVRTLEVPGGGPTSQGSCAYFLSQVSQGPPREPQLWGPPRLGPSSPPSSECCRKHWDPSFSAGVTLLAVSASLSWTQSPGRKRKWEMVKAGKSFCLATRKGSG